MSETNDQYIIQKETLTGIADAVREMRLNDNLLLPENMPDEIRAIRTGLDQSIDTVIREDDPEWTRPDGWPDLDSIEIPDGFDGVYLTYDLSKTKGYGWIGVFVQLAVSSERYLVERGHLENGIFISDYSAEMNRGEYFRESLDEANGMVQLWRVSSSGHITRCSLACNDNNTNNCMQNNMQPMVERRGVLPYVTDLSSSISTNQSYTSMGTIWLERDNLLPGSGKVTSLSSMYQDCYRLEKASLAWDTTEWIVRTMPNMFLNCYRLKAVDFGTWDTSGWAVTAMQSLFKWCMSLKHIDLSSFRTSSWAVTNFSDMFNSCLSVEEINLTGWDTSGWRPTSFNTMFAYCRNLRRIVGLDTLVTSNWVITTLSNMFVGAYSLERLDLSRWDTTNWAVTNMGNTFQNCVRLKELDLSTWNTENWAVTSLVSTFNACNSLMKLNLSHWDTSNWRVTSMENCWVNCWNLKELHVPFNTLNWPLTASGFRYTFQNMYSIKRLDLSAWDTTNWTIADTRSTFSSDRSLEEIIGIDQWNTSNWRVTYINAFFYQCYSLKNVDLSGWDTSKWEVVNCESMLLGCQKIENAAGIGQWDVSNWAVTTIGSMISGSYSMRRLDLSQWNASHFQLGGIYNLLAECFNMEELIFPDSLDLSNVTNVNYTTPASGYTVKECNFYLLKNGNLNINYWYSLSRESLLSLFDKLQETTTTRTVNVGKINRLKLTPEEIAIATQKGWTVAG